MDAPEPSSPPSPPPRKAPTLKELWAQPLGRLLVVGVVGATLLIGARCSSEPIPPEAPAPKTAAAAAPLAYGPVAEHPAPDAPPKPVEQLRQSLAAYDAILRDLEVSEVLARRARGRAEPGSSTERALDEQARALADQARRLRELRAAALGQALTLDTLLLPAAAAIDEPAR